MSFDEEVETKEYKPETVIQVENILTVKVEWSWMITWPSRQWPLRTTSSVIVSRWFFQPVVDTVFLIGWYWSRRGRRSCKVTLIWHWTECLIYHFNNFAKKCCSKADIEKTDYGFPLVSTRLIRLSLGFHGCQNKPNLSVVYKAACQFAIFYCQKWLIISDVLWWCTMPRKISLRNNCTFCSAILAGLGDDSLNVDGHDEEKSEN